MQTDNQKTRSDEDLKRALREKERQLEDIQHKWNVWKEQTTQTLVKKCREEVNKEMERFVCLLTSEDFASTIGVILVAFVICSFITGVVLPSLLLDIETVLLCKASIIFPSTMLPLSQMHFIVKLHL